jgi:hypothetical protein
MMRTALGFRVHSGWAAMVVAATSQVLDRRRIEITDPRLPGSVQPYHHAKTLSLPEAKQYLDHCAKQSRKMALTAIEDALDRHRVAACGILMSSARPAGTLEATLASHAAIHSAEGEFFRDAILHAAGACSISCRKIKEKELLNVARTELGIRDPEAFLTEMRKTLGAPWTQDEKYAALAGWVALKL